MNRPTHLFKVRVKHLLALARGKGATLAEECRSSPPCPRGLPRQCYSSHPLCPHRNMADSCLVTYVVKTLLILLLFLIYLSKVLSFLSPHSHISSMPPTGHARFGRSFHILFSSFESVWYIIFKNFISSEML